MKRSLAALAAALLVCGCGEQNQKSAQQKTLPSPKATAPTITQQAAQPPVAPAVVQPTAPPVQKNSNDAATRLIAQVDREYEQGQDNYRPGHLSAAKQNFDRAVDMMLTSPLSPKSDPRLMEEFEKVVEHVNQLEMAALQQGDGFTEQKSVPAPIAELNEMTFPVDPNVRAQAQAELAVTTSDLPLVINDYVASFLSFFQTQRGRGVIERALTRAGRYRSMIQRILKEEGVPQDLMFLAQAESGFQPTALNPSGARGMWQLMSSRASEYGLQHTWWIDERQDPEKATRAAAKHLHDLYKQFGDWYLVMAAYDSGPGNVQYAVEKTGYADFWELYRRNVLPKETKNYVPIILAMTIVAKNPAQYGLQNVQPEPPAQVDAVTIDYPVDLRLVAECIDSTAGVIQQLNPSLLRMSTPKEGNFILKLPLGTAARYQEAISAIPADKRIWWRYHQVSSGETLASIAREYKTTQRSITEVNGLDAGEITPETKLIIPIAAGKHAPGDVENAVFSRHATRYRVRSGDTVLSVADDFNVPPEKLRRWNHMKGNLLRKGRVLLVYRPLPVGTAQPVNRKYRKKSNLHASAHSSAVAAKSKKQKARASHPPSSETLAGSSTSSHQR